MKLGNKRVFNDKQKLAKLIELRESGKPRKPRKPPIRKEDRCSKCEMLKTSKYHIQNPC